MYTYNEAFRPIFLIPAARAVLALAAGFKIFEQNGRT